MTNSSGDVQDTNSNDTVGLVGVGKAGKWFVTKLSREGYEPVVSDIEPEAVAGAVDRGAIAGEHPADVTARSDIIVLALPTREAVETVMEGDDGILETLETGQVVIDTGTTTPDVDVLYQKLCRERGAGYVDCGMTRHGPGQLEQREEPAYTMFVGGDRADYGRVKPVIDVLSHTHEFFDGIGNGHIVKAAVVLRATCMATMAAEVCEFLSNNGIDEGRVIDLLDWDIPAVYADPPSPTNRGFERAVQTDEGTTEDRGFRVAGRGARPRLRTSIWAKDPAYALSVAHASNSYVPMLTAAYQTRLVTENYGTALVDRDLHFNDPEWRTFHLRSVYRALNRPQEEWRRLSKWSDE